MHRRARTHSQARAHTHSALPPLAQDGAPQRRSAPRARPRASLARTAAQHPPPFGPPRDVTGTIPNVLRGAGDPPRALRPAPAAGVPGAAVIHRISAQPPPAPAARTRQYVPTPERSEAVEPKATEGLHQDLKPSCPGAALC
ncbi:uncharacterized protein LOC127471434 [Manacus candei]|uniref:uncharacterized protein LOC127471434 n=1 Tax=Manacus candei TaxID=415023 RepID=UPI0022269CD9|nr:uncharacterized protein LOC127471434 [Manacus candei]